MVKFLFLHAQGCGQALHLLDEAFHQLQHSHLTRGGDDVVGGLGHVDVIIGVYNAVVALLAAQNLDGTVGYHFVHIHVIGGSCAALDGVGDELIRKLAGKDFVTGLYDGVADMGRKVAMFTVYQRSGFLDLCQRAGEALALLSAGNVEILLGSHRLQAIVYVFVQLKAADHIPFNTHDSNLLCTIMQIQNSQLRQ